MFDEAQQPHHQPTNVRSNRKMQKIQRALSFLQFLPGVATALFLAGVVVPSFVRSGKAAAHDGAANSLHALTIGRVTFWFTLQNLGSALLGGVFGLLVALAIEFFPVLSKTARKFVVFQQGHLSDGDRVPANTKGSLQNRMTCNE